MSPTAAARGNSVKPTPPIPFDFIVPIHLKMKIKILVFALTLCCAQIKLAAGQGHWMTTWGCGPQLTEPGNLPPAPLANSTLREFVHGTVGGNHLRVRFSNAYGTNSVAVNSAHVALAAGTGSATNGVINLATDQALTFHGAPSVIIPAGEVVYSDPLDYNLPALTNLAVSIYFGSISATTINGHPGSRTTSYIRPGNWVTATGISNAVPTTTTTAHWYIITGVEVLADMSSKTLVTLGDSITDGRGSTTDGNNRWPDDLAQRLATNAPTAGVAVANMGIGGGCVIAGGLGPTALKRFDRDVINQNGARWLIVFEGVNDIGGDSTGTVATNLIAAYTQFANKAHAHNVAAYGATITPFGGNGYYSTSHEASRQAVNAWLRTNTIFDGVIDFDAVVRDPVTLTNIQAAYYYGLNAGDGLHMNPAGYQAMATNVDLSLFTH
jgi:lysophospholipase L1-like esterase